MPVAAHAQDGDLAARAEVAAPVAATNTEDASASGTSVELRARTGALESLSDVIGDVPGARVQSTGGFGAFAGVSLRGAGIEHTTVLLGELPISTADTGAFDLSLIPPDSLDSIEIYRGGAPVWWSDGAVGGIVRLVPRSARQSFLQAQTGFGSYGRFELATTSSVVRDDGAKPALLSHVGFARADNDYPYVEDGQTLFDTNDMSASEDDRLIPQRNAQIDSANALLHAGIDLWSGRIDLVVTAHGRTQGIPGPLAAPTPHVHRDLLQSIAALSFTKEARAADDTRRYRVQALAGGTYQKNQLSDVDAQLGISQNVASDDDATRGYARIAGSVALARFLEPTLIASITRDDFRPDNALAFGAPSRPSGRTTSAVALEPRFHGAIGATQLELRPSVRAQYSQTSIWTTGLRELANGREERNDTLATARIAGVIAPMPALAFSASASTGARLPSILELFGDRVIYVPSLNLKPERSRTCDASVVARGRSGELRGSVELRGFALWVDDLIAYERRSQLTFRAQNVDEARVLGGELGTHGEYGRNVSLDGSITLMDTHNQFDLSVPLRPPLTFNARPELALFPGFADRLSFFAEVEHTSFVYLDDANRTFLEARTLFSAGATLALFRERVALSLRAQNIFDAQATDVLSHPLPGTQLFATLTVREGLD